VSHGNTVTVSLESVLLIGARPCRL